MVWSHTDKVNCSAVHQHVTVTVQTLISLYKILYFLVDLCEFQCIMSIYIVHALFSHVANKMSSFVCRFTYVLHICYIPFSMVLTFLAELNSYPTPPPPFKRINGNNIHMDVNKHASFFKDIWNVCRFKSWWSLYEIYDHVVSVLYCQSDVWSSIHSNNPTPFAQGLQNGSGVATLKHC